MGLGLKSPDKKPPNDGKYKLMFLFYVFYLVFFLCLCFNIQMCKIFCVFSIIIKTFLSLYFNSLYLSILSWTIFIYLYLCTHYPAIYGLTLILIYIIFFNKLFLWIWKCHKQWKYLLKNLSHQSKNKNKGVSSSRNIYSMMRK